MIKKQKCDYKPTILKPIKHEYFIYNYYVINIEIVINKNYYYFFL
jgi:hypothetical protein